MSARYEKVMFRPEGETRSRSVILKNPQVTGRCLTGIEVKRDGDEVTAGGADERRRVIEMTLVTRRQEMRMDVRYAHLVLAD